MSKKLLNPKWFSLFGLLVIAALALTACQGIPNTGATATSAPPPTEAPPAATATTAPVAGADGPATVMVSENDEFGQFLVDDKGMTLYLFTNDEPNTVNCAGECLVKWPPLLTDGDPVAGEGVDASLLGTAPMPDGSSIVTYNGWPLYYWINDKAPGETTGQNVGEVWFVVSPAGEMITGAAGEEMEPTEEMSDSESTGGATVMVSESDDLGQFLVDDKGMTLYLFTKDEPNVSNCKGDCLVNWPPFLTEGDPVAGEGVDQSKLGTAELDDGSMIVTYDGAPLYYWKNDAAPGDTTGQNVGEVWFVVAP